MKYQIIETGIMICLFNNADTINSILSSNLDYSNLYSKIKIPTSGLVVYWFEYIKHLELKSIYELRVLPNY